MHAIPLYKLAMARNAEESIRHAHLRLDDVQQKAGEKVAPINFFR